MSNWLVAAGVVLLAILGAAFLAQAPGGQTGPEPVPPTVEEAATAVVQSSPPTTLAAGEVRDEYLGRELDRDALPHFLRPWAQYGLSADPAERVQGALQWLEARRAEHDDESSVLFLGTTLERTFRWGTQDITIYYPRYAVLNGEYHYLSGSQPIPLAEESPDFPHAQYMWLNGELSDEEYASVRRTLSQVEFEKVHQFICDTIVEAWNSLWNECGLRQVWDEIVSIQEERFGDALWEPLPWNIDPPLTLAEVLGIPRHYPTEYPVSYTHLTLPTKA